MIFCDAWIGERLRFDGIYCLRNGHNNKCIGNMLGPTEPQKRILKNQLDGFLSAKFRYSKRFFRLCACVCVYIITYVTLYQCWMKREAEKITFSLAEGSKNQCDNVDYML